SGKDSAVLVGMAKAIGIPILGLPGPLEKEGLILRHAVSLWVESPLQALRRIKTVARCHLHDDRELPCTKCRSERICALAGTKIS
ncbi:MAG: translation initiation factor 2, partial [Desulfovibrio sp.]